MKLIKANITRILLSIILSLSLISLSSVKVFAYTPNGYKLSSPKNIVFYVASTLDGYSVPTYVKKWSSYCPELAFKQVSNISSTNIIMGGSSTVDNGTYGVTTHGSNNSHSVVFYKLFYNATSSVRNETIVHEVGHCVGLAHPSATINQSTAVMRATGFNGKAYPLSDDIKGIAAIY